MATLDTHKAVRELTAAGAGEPLAEKIVGVVEEASADLVTKDYFDKRLAQTVAAGTALAVTVAAAAVAVAEAI
ncbi:MAG: hypothetical protein OXH41_05065 [Chloroflexi bacterium]|nr:hypothetical protein [Chloroflexota bacterium]